MSNTERIFVHEQGARTPVASLTPYLAQSLDRGQLMDPTRMRDEAKACCRWLGYGIGKGVTHTENRVSVFGVPDQLICGLHGELIQGFDDIPVDATPICYERLASLGFDAFIRWVYLADPTRHHDFFGIDWSLAMPSTGGVATSMIQVERLAQVAIAHGIPRETEVVLLSADMCEPLELEAWRMQRALISLEDWVAFGKSLFAPRGNYCPRCGSDTFPFGRRGYCTQCGCRPELIRKRGAHGVSPRAATI